MSAKIFNLLTHLPKKSIKKNPQKKITQLLYTIKNNNTFATAKRRLGRVVDGGSLENCCTATYRGFESLSLRKELENSQRKLTVSVFKEFV